MHRKRRRAPIGNSSYQLQVRLARRELDRKTAELRRAQTAHDRAAADYERRKLRTLVDRTTHVDGEDPDEFSGGSDEEEHIQMYQRQRKRQRNRVAQTGTAAGQAFNARNDLQEGLEGLVPAHAIPRFDHHKPYGPADWNWDPSQAARTTQFYVNLPHPARLFIGPTANAENTPDPTLPTHPNIPPQP